MFSREEKLARQLLQHQTLSCRWLVFIIRISQMYFYYESLTIITVTIFLLIWEKMKFPRNTYLSIILQGNSKRNIKKSRTPYKVNAFNKKIIIWIGRECKCALGRKQTDKAKVKWRKSATGFLLNNQHLPHTFVRKLSHCTNSLFSPKMCHTYNKV